MESLKGSGSGGEGRKEWEEILDLNIVKIEYYIIMVDENPTRFHHYPFIYLEFTTDVEDASLQG